jgi:hypothetical protein
MANSKIRKDIDLEDGEDGLKSVLESELKNERLIARRQNYRAGHLVPVGTYLNQTHPIFNHNPPVSIETHP